MFQIMSELSSWGLRFSEDLVECQGRIINPQRIVQSSSYASVNGDWSGQMRSNFSLFECKLL